MTSPAFSSPWIACRLPAPSASRALLGIAHAGGGVSVFRFWPGALAPDFEMWAAQLPGREARADEPLVTDALALGEELADAVVARDDPRPLVLLGHSMGALVAFEAARALRRRDRTPAGLVVASIAAPDAPRPEAPRHLQSDPELLALLRDFGGTPDWALAHPELMELVLPVLRADLAVVDTYRFREEPPLPGFLLALTGRDDEAVPLPVLEGWRRHAAGRFVTEALPGGHFGLHGAMRRVATLVRQLVAAR